jgi:transposase
VPLAGICAGGRPQGRSLPQLKAAGDARDRDSDRSGLDESERAELRRLRRENIELRADREILRKAAAYFARETMR